MAKAIGAEFHVMETLVKGYTLENPPHGYVRYIDHMGTDMRIVEAARVSYHAPLKGEAEDRKLLNYLFRMRHTSPFEQCNITFNIKMPIFLMRQFVRHRMFRLNEWSGRYSMLEDKFFMPAIWRKQSTTNKQGSAGEIAIDSQFAAQALAISTYNKAYDAYLALLDFGVAKEQARMVLPVAIYTEIYVNCDLHNLIHFLRLRMDSHAQEEMRDMAGSMATIFRLLFPLTFEAFCRYQLRIVDSNPPQS